MIIEMVALTRFEIAFESCCNHSYWGKGILSSRLVSYFEWI